MCYFVAVGCESSLARTVEHVLGYRLEAAPEYVANAFPAGVSAFLIRRGCCSCDAFKPPHDDAEISRLARRCAERGWTEARTNRFMAEAQKYGGLEVELTRRIVNAAKRVNGLSMLVYWDDGRPITFSASISAHGEDLMANRALIRTGRRVDIQPA